MKILQFFAVLSLVVLLSACNLQRVPTERYLKSRTAEALFEAGDKALAKGKYETAVKKFEDFEAKHPFDARAQQAQLNLIYAHYKADDSVSAAAAADRYVHLYPRSKHVDYAYYMKGVANFAQDRGLLARYIPIDVSIRDPGTSHKAYYDFANLIKRFPNSPYAADARQRMIYLRNLFAQRELHVAEFYMGQHAYVGAINRASYIVEIYPQSPQAKKALVIMVEANRKLGLTKEADDALRILQINYPNTVL